MNYSNIEHYTGLQINRGSISQSRGSSYGSYTGSRYNTKSSISPKRRPVYTSTSHTLGRTGGSPFWGWGYYPWTTVLYPFSTYANYPEFIEYAPVEEEKKEVKSIEDSKEKK